MITSAENRQWPGDLRIANLEQAGLPAPSIIRPSKIATIDTHLAEHLGRLEPSEFDRVLTAIEQTLGLPPR